MTTRAEALAAAAVCFAEARELRDSLPVEEAARIAYTPTGPSIEELERRIRARRTETTRPAQSGAPRAAARGRATKSA